MLTGSRTVYCVGGIYATIQNLPRDLRYREEYIVLFGIIPRKPKLSVDSYLQSLVDELQSAYSNGLIISTPQGTDITIRLAISCISCDIPASRKVCGFLGHNARLGCNKCYKFTRSWKLRTCEEHLSHCEEVLPQVTKSAIQAAKSKHGFVSAAIVL